MNREEGYFMRTDLERTPQRIVEDLSLFVILLAPRRWVSGQERGNDRLE
jgi:hypothetical protein